MTMPASNADRNLLFGILALQMDFISREQLITAMHAWVLAKDRSLAQHLVEAGALRDEYHKLLEPLVDAHIRRHGDDPQQSLASVSSIDSSLRSALQDVDDPQLRASLDQVSIVRPTASSKDPLAT